MTAREMHYDFKQKINKIDSQKYRDLLVPEIDWRLTEAQEVFVKSIAQPRFARIIGFETSQRNIDDIRTLVVDQKRGSGITPTIYDTNKYLAPLPDDYWYYIQKGTVIASKGTCLNKALEDLKVSQHNDQHESSPFDRASFEWGATSLEFNKDGIIIYTDGSFTISEFCMSYIRYPRMIYNAQDFKGGSYKTMSGVTLTGSQSCELPAAVHREVVDLAVLIATGDLQIPDYPIKANKLKLTT